MERGLLWLPLLFLFFWLTWMGWKEFNKVEAYRLWAQSFDKSKYDIYSVLGLKDKEITWGQPSRPQPINLKTFSLENVQEIRLLVNDKPVSFESFPSKGTAHLEFIVPEGSSIKIPFTEIPLAAQWGQYLQTLIINSNQDNPS